MTADFSHIWLQGDRIACMECDSIAYEVEFVGPNYPLCPDCRKQLEHDEEVA